MSNPFKNLSNQFWKDFLRKSSLRDIRTLAVVTIRHTAQSGLCDDCNLWE